jgi:excinuclease ABC subunit C
MFSCRFLFYRGAAMTKAELYQKACMLPLLPGVYIIRDKSDTIIYIGKAKRLRIRVSQYFREGVPHDNKVSQMIAHAYAFDVIVCQSEFEALVLEASQIKAHTPKYNILLKDDKGYSYIKVTREAWPRLSFVLQKEEDDAEYIGPYTSSFAARQMAETALDAFLLPRCSKRFPQDIGKGRPCLNAHIGKCMAVCSGKISCENYNQAVKNAVHLIRYGKKDILKTLNERMLEASDRLEFETAALLRDQINAITKVTAGQKVVVDPEVEMDVVALAGTPSSVCAAVLRFREGRLTDKREFLFHDTADIAAVREEFLPRYYLDDEQIPKIIAVDELPPDSEALQQALNEKRGSEVQLYVPQRGDKPIWWRWPTPTRWNGWPGRAAATPVRKSCWMRWRRCWGFPSRRAPLRATISPTGAMAPASAAWSPSGMASPTKPGIGSSG